MLPLGRAGHRLPDRAPRAARNGPDGEEEGVLHGMWEEDEQCADRARLGRAFFTGLDGPGADVRSGSW
jgi:hypothetical protein